MPIGYNQDVELLIAARTAGGDDVDKLARQINGLEADLRDFEKVGKSVSVLEGAQDKVEFFKQSLSLAQGRVRQLQATLAEAFNVGMDAPGIKALEKQLAAAQRAANAAATDLTRAQNTVDRLDAAGAKAGVTVANLAAKKAQLAAESEKVRQKVDALRTSLDQSAAAEKNLAAGASSVNAAFATLNIRSAAKINADIEAINQALVRLASNSKVSGADFDRAYAGAQVRLGALRAELAGAEAAAGKTSTAVSGMGASLEGLAGIGAALAIGREFITANVGAESLERTLVQLTGSGETAAAEIEYLKAASNRLGLSLQESSRAYISLTAAAKGTSLEGAGTRQIFEAVAGSMAKLGKSSADTEGALQAVAQMMSNGKVSMEEWRQQLGERLPGAMQATADAAGITVEQLNKMIADGKVLSTDILPLLAAGLEKVYGTASKAEGSVAAWNRLKNSINETMVLIGQTGVWNASITGLDNLNIKIRKAFAGIDTLGKYWDITGKAIGEFDWSKPADSIKRWGDSLKAAAEDAVKKIDGVATATEKANSAQEKHAQDEKRREKETADAAAMKLRLQAAYEGLEKSAKDGVEQSVKSAAARAEEGKASVDLASALGSESEKRTAALNAAKTDAAALISVADARRRETEVAAAYAESMKAMAGAEEDWTQAQREAIAEAEKSTALRAADAEKSAAEAVRAQQRASQLALETEMLKDNSARLGELKAAADAAGVALENMRKLKEQGIATEQQVKDAEIAGAQAKALYRDALNDQTKAIEYNAAMKGKETDLKAAGLRLEIEQIRSMAEVAKAYGDETTAAVYLAQAKQLEIELAELQAKAKRAEAESSLQIIKAKRAELQASGDLTVEKEREMKAQEMGAQVKLKEAEIADETANRMRQLAAATADGANSAEAAAGSYDKLAGSLRGVEDAAAGAGNGVRNVSGSALGKMGGQSQADFTETLYRRGGTIEEVKLAQKYVSEFYARNQATMLTGNLGNEENASRMMQRAINDAVDKALAAARTEKATGQAVDLGTSVADLQTRNLSKTPLRSLDDMISRIKAAGNEANRPTPQKTIRLEFAAGGKTSAVHADDEESANAFIKTLEAAGMRAAR